MKKLILLSLLAVLLISGCSLAIPIRKNVKKTLNPEEAMAAAEKFINENLLPANVKAAVKSAVLEGDVYNINLEVSGQDYNSYMTKDGGKFFQSGVDIATFIEEKAKQEQAGAPQENAPVAAAPKSDKPKVELFVMTHCPYGLQAEKGFLPAMEALGNKIDASIKFVHYFMHGDAEEQETYNQVCVREEQTAKFNSYLNCFVIENDSAKCVIKAGVDKTKMNNCVKSKAKDYYKADSALSNQYGVGGSPTLVINGIQSGAGRDSASYLSDICAAFNTPPSECAKQLSSAAPSSGFGAGTDSSGAAASCN